MEFLRKNEQKDNVISYAIRKQFHNDIKYYDYHYISKSYNFPRGIGSSTALKDIITILKDLNPDLKVYIYGRISSLSFYKDCDAKIVIEPEQLRGIGGKDVLIVTDCFTEFANKSNVKEFKSILKHIGINNKIAGKRTINININSGSYREKSF